MILPTGNWNYAQEKQFAALARYNLLHITDTVALWPKSRNHFSTLFFFGRCYYANVNEDG
jgi:hypothetical protein